MCVYTRDTYAHAYARESTPPQKLPMTNTNVF